MEEEHAYAQHRSRDESDMSGVGDDRPRKSEKKKKKKKSKSKHRESEFISSDSPDRDLQRTDEEGEERRPAKKKSKKRSKEGREHRAPRKSKSENEAGLDGGGITPKRGLDGGHGRQPISHSSLASTSQASTGRTNSSSTMDRSTASLHAERTSVSDTAASNLSQFERDVRSKNEARRTARAATAPGVVAVTDDEAKPRARPLAGAVSSRGGTQYGKTSGRFSQVSVARAASMASAPAGGGMAALEDNVAIRRAYSASAAGGRSASLRSNLRTLEDDVVAKNHVSSQKNVTVVDPSANLSRSGRSTAAAVGGAALIGASLGAGVSTWSQSPYEAVAAEAVALLESEVLAKNQTQVTYAPARPPGPTTIASVEASDVESNEGERADLNVESTSQNAAAVPATPVAELPQPYSTEAGVPRAVDESAPDTATNPQSTEIYPGVNFGSNAFVNEGAVDAFVADNVVDALGVAVVISEEEEENLERRKYKRYLCYAFLCMCLVAVAIVVPVVLVLGKEEPVAPSLAPSGAPSMTPSIAPTTERLDAVIDSLIEVSGEEAFTNRTSSQYLAANWVANMDPLALPVGDPQLIQRYILAVFYFSTNGDVWFLCGRTDPICGGDPNETSWLSEYNECTWLANRCQDGVNVDRIFFARTFGNQLNGTLPSELVKLPKLEGLIMQNNFIRGTLPEFLGSISLLNTLILSGNLIEGTIPEVVLESVPLLGTIHLSRMNMTGSIPTQFGLLPLADLRLDENGFTGPVPAELGTISELRILDLQMNELDGSLPGSIFTLPSLAQLRVGENKLEGSIPETVSQLVNLTEIWMNATEIGGTLPETLYSLPNLTSINLSGANFNGTLSENVGNLTKLRFLYLENNRLTGTIPSRLDLLTGLNDLTLHGNDFVGTISQGLCSRKGSNFFDLQNLTADCAEPSPQITCPEDCCDICV